MLELAVKEITAPMHVVFGGQELDRQWPDLYKSQWEGFAASVAIPEDSGVRVYIHWGDPALWTLRKVKELCAVAARSAQKLKVTACTLALDAFLERFGSTALHAVAEGLAGGLYGFSRKAQEEPRHAPDFYVLQTVLPAAVTETTIAQAWRLAQEICFARDMVNEPGNLLRPTDFADAIATHVKNLPVEAECISYQSLCEQGYGGIVGVGGGSAFKPCLVVLRYRGAPKSTACLGIAGKGVTCDTGGYCVKSSVSMRGIKGDMAGAAAAAAAVCALAANNVPVNVTVALPLCENRISPDAVLPGDVLTLYGGKVAEVLNTDAEGRLILADAVAHLAKNEQVSQIVDIATLTGAAWSALGYTIAPALCDDNDLYKALESAAEKSAECYVRFPFGEEHEKMIRSEIADLKNIGGDCCGAITAGLFIRAFAQGLPWLHLDIAGTSWTTSANFLFETFGATGAGTATLYHLAALVKEEKL